MLQKDHDGLRPMTQPRIQERSARWLLLLTLLHTVPVIWITPVAAGTAPTAALLALGLASLLSFEGDNMSFALFTLGPALLYCGIGWIFAWQFAKRLERLRNPLRAALLAILIAAALVSVYWPIYVAGSHNSSRSANLLELFRNTLDERVLLGYWIALHVVLIALYAATLLRRDHPILNFVERWRKPAFSTVAVALCVALLIGNYPMLICRPLAEIGSGRAALCVARSVRRDQRHWYERAAEQGQSEAIAWMIEHAQNQEQKLYWLRKGAELGDAATQFALYERLMRSGDNDARVEAEAWLQSAAEGNHAPAQIVLADMLTRTIHSSRSSELLVERNTWLERAARLGARDAKRQLAAYHVDGSMGYPVDLNRARGWYRELAEDYNPAGAIKPTRYERMLNLDAAYYTARIAQLNSWEAGLKRRDPVITKSIAERYLRSQYPGPGVRELGLKLMEELAAAGDATARDALAMMLRTGSSGVEKDLDAAKQWMIAAAEAGDADAMARVASNYTKGREGFAVDFPEARRWFQAAIDTLTHSDAEGAQDQIRRLRNELAYLDRRAEKAGGTLLGRQALTQLGEGTDAESNYQYAVQLLAGHGSDRRAEAIARLNDASRQGHGEAAWRLFQIYERGFREEIDSAAAIEQLERAAANHHFNATRELAIRYEYGRRGLPTDLPRAITLYENAIAAGHDNRYDWNLDPDIFNHFKWLESRLRQARMKQGTQAGK
jgi:TPR repeat protein